MENSVTGELLVLFLLILNCGRIFFLRYGKIDSLTVLAPVCLILSLLQIAAWNADGFSALILALSVLAFFTNFRALLRLLSGLYVDHYRPAFTIASALILLVAVAETAVLVFFYPVSTDAGQFGVSETKIRLSGSFGAGFSEAARFSGADAVLYVYEPETKGAQSGAAAASESGGGRNGADAAAAGADAVGVTAGADNADNAGSAAAAVTAASDIGADADNAAAQSGAASADEKKPVVLFVSDRRSDTRNCAPYLMSLAHLGYTVLSCDFYAQDLKWFHSAADAKWFRQTAMLLKYFRRPEFFFAEREFYTYNTGRECAALLALAEEMSGGDAVFFLVCDEMSGTAAADFYAAARGKIIGLFNIAEVPEYHTPGFGCVELTAPAVAYTLGYGRASDFSAPESMAAATAESIRGAQSASVSERNLE